MDAASAEEHPMEPGTAGSNQDPCQVVTPLNPLKTKALLCKYNLLDTWYHIVVGLINGFDVGIHAVPNCMYIFQEPCIIPSQP